VSAPGSSRRPVPAHLCAGCRPILSQGAWEPTLHRVLRSRRSGPGPVARALDTRLGVQLRLRAAEQLIHLHGVTESHGSARRVDLQDRCTMVANDLGPYRIESQPARGFAVVIAGAHAVSSSGERIRGHPAADRGNAPILPRPLQLEHHSETCKGARARVNKRRDSDTVPFKLRQERDLRLGFVTEHSERGGGWGDEG
jgi:hypothetical protein